MTYRKVQRPSRDLLSGMVQEQGVDAAAAAFGVHRDTIRRWCRLAGIGLEQVRNIDKQGPIAPHSVQENPTRKVQAKPDTQGAQVHKVVPTYIGAHHSALPRGNFEGDDRTIVSAPRSLIVPALSKYTLDYATAPPAGVLLGRGTGLASFGNNLLRIEPNGIDWQPDHGMAMLAVLASGLCQLDLDGPPTLVNNRWSLVRRVYLDLPTMLIELGWVNDRRNIAKLIRLIRDLAVPWFRLNGNEPIRFIIGRSEAIHGRPAGRPTQEAARSRWLESWVDIRFEFFSMLSHYQFDWDVLRDTRSDLARRLAVMLTTDKRLTIPAPMLVSPSVGMPPAYYRRKLAIAHEELLDLDFLASKPVWDGYHVTYVVDPEHRDHGRRRVSPLYLPSSVRAVIGLQAAVHPLDREDFRRIAARALTEGAEAERVAHSLIDFMRFGSHSAKSLGAVWEHRVKEDIEHPLDESQRARVRWQERLYLEHALGTEAPVPTEAAA